MQDLELAKKRLGENGLTLSIVKSGEVIFETVSHGVSGMLEAVERFAGSLEGASVADRIAGRATALLCAQGRVKAVYAETLSRKAQALFTENGIYHEWSDLVDNILNADKTDVCPFEKLAAEIVNPSEAYGRLKALQNSMKRDGWTHANQEHKRFISEEDEELKRIRQSKIKQLMERKEREQRMGTHPTQVTDANFSQMVRQNSLALIDCWAPWCGPCLALGPIIEELASDFAGKVFIGKLNVDENPKTAQSFQVFSIPTMLIMKGEKEVDRIVGLVSKKSIEAALNKHLG